MSKQMSIKVFSEDHRKLQFIASIKSSKPLYLLDKIIEAYAKQEGISFDELLKHPTN